MILQTYLLKVIVTRESIRSIHKNAVRNLSAEKGKKQTTPFGGMARPYYSLAAHSHPSRYQPFHIVVQALFLSPKFSQECC